VVAGGVVRVRRADDVVFEVVDGRAILVDPAGTELITLNPVGTLVWDALAEPRDERDIVDELSGRFRAVAPDELARDCARFLDELRDLGVVASADAEH
jgi:hypothetical protein